MTNCIICGGRSFNAHYGNTLKRCTSCGFTTANMEVGEELMKSIYSINYFMGEEYMDYLKDKEVLQLNFEKRIGLIKKAGKNIPSISNCLEIGCAYGFFGEVLLKHIKTEFKGIDIVPQAIKHGSEVLNLNLVAGDYLNEPMPAKLYTDVFMWDVIEHLRDPHLFIRKVYSELEQGGRVYITTGDIGALLPRIQKKAWRMIHPPSHIHYFSKATLTLLLENYGFKVINTKYLPVYRSIRQIFYSLFLLKKSGKISLRLFNLIPRQWYIPVNTFDIVCMTAIKA